MSRPPGQAFPDGQAFFASLATRLKRHSPGPRYQRALKVFTFTRLLDRIAVEFADSMILKGGMALELRIPGRARMTRDIDLRFSGDATKLHDRLGVAGMIDRGDFLTYTFERPEPITNVGLIYGGHAFKTTCWLEGRVHERFKVEVGVGDPVHGAPDLIACDDTLAFLGIAPPVIHVYPVETHVAEKLHAYSFIHPEGREGSRVKDLPDLAMLASLRTFDVGAARAAIEQTFAHRRTHAVPTRLMSPPSSWRDPYAKIARDALLRWPDLDAAYTAVAAFLDPVLGAHDVTRWEPASWRWT